MLSAYFGGITSRVIYALVTAFLAAFVLTPWTTRRLQAKQFGQVIREEGVEAHLKKAGTPTMGGLVMLVAVMVASLFWARPTWQVAATLGMLACLGVLGFQDDFLKVTKRTTDGVSGRGKLAVQGALAGALGVALLHFGLVQPTLFVPVLDLQVNLGWGWVGFMMLVIVGASNAVNLTDGLDGLAAGILAIVSMGLAGVGYVAGNTIFSAHLAIPYVPGSGELAVVCASLTGACIGFLWYNTHPATLFMGDTGSLAMGGALGVVAVLVRQELMLALIGGIFVLEAVSVILQVGSYRLRNGKRIFLMAPIHHHFEKKGWAETKVVVRFWILTLVLALMGASVLGLHSVLHRKDEDPRAAGASAPAAPPAGTGPGAAPAPTSAPASATPPALSAPAP